MKQAIYAGSFDPITYGHLSIIKTGLEMVELLTVALGVHTEKSCLFSSEERCKMVKEAIKSEFPQDYARVNVVMFENLLVDVSAKLDVLWLLRGVRDSIDFEYERRMLDINSYLARGAIHTILIPAKAEYRAISSSAVKEIARLNGDLHALVPANVQDALLRKFIDKRRK